MMLVQKPPHMSMSPPHFPLAQHRRHPSAPPAVLVQPTRTPGLLSLSKPVQRLQQPTQRAKPPLKPRPAATARQSPQPSHAEPALKPSPEIVDKKPRGRQSVQIPDSRPARSVSNSSIRGRRNNTRQPSPPLSNTPLQAEAPTNLQPQLQLSSQPSGKLARRRQPQQAKSLTGSPSTRPIPVPQRPKSIPPMLSQSMPSKVKDTPDVAQWKFPVCDDDDDCPSTPSRPRAKRFDNGPQTAPLTNTTGSFPFNMTPSPHKKGRKHTRTPSEGLFHMSSDEDLSSSSSDEKASIRRQAMSLMRAGKLTEAEMEAAVAAGYFASSTFQNSPSPEDLPPPIFV